MNAELRNRLDRIERDMDRIPSRLAQGAAGAAPLYPWVQALVRGGQTLIATAPKVYGIKRKVGEAKPAHWIYTPVRATAICYLGFGANAGKVTTVSMTNIGKCYIINPVVSVSAPPSGGTQAVITAAYSDNGYVEGVYVTNCGSLYYTTLGSALPLVTFSDPPSGTTAQGHVALRDGKVTGIIIDDSGSGYVTAPTITIAASDGGGTTATAACVLGKGKIALTITNPGAGYVTAPTITIAPPIAQPIPMTPMVADDSPAQWADGIGWGIIQGGSLTGGLTSTLPALICHDDRSLVPYGLIGDGGSAAPGSRVADAVLSWYRTTVRLSIADNDADGVLEAWVPMAGGA